jgi:predicted regulator of amino acid metabolism with ACT domain
MASVASILAKHDMVIRQALAEDPDMVPDAKMIVIVEGSIGSAFQELNQLDMVKSIKILK